MSHRTHFLPFIVSAFLVHACSGPIDTGDSAVHDVVTVDASDVSSSDHVVPVDVASDVPAVDVVTIDVSDVSVADVSVNDVPVDTSVAPCVLPLGGTCPAGTTCPAGDSCNDCTCPATGGTPMCTARPCHVVDAGSHDAGPTNCTTASQCRLFSNYCSTAACTCDALGTGDPDPVCHGTTVTCFLNPCASHTVDCVGGSCVVR